MESLNTIPDVNVILNMCRFINDRSNKMLTVSSFETLIKSGGAYLIKSTVSEIMSLFISIDIEFTHSSNIRYDCYFASENKLELPDSEYIQFVSDRKIEGSKKIYIHIFDSNIKPVEDMYVHRIAKYSDYINFTRRDDGCKVLTERCWNRLQFDKYLGIKNGIEICCVVLWYNVSKEKDDNYPTVTLITHSKSEDCKDEDIIYLIRYISRNIYGKNIRIKICSMSDINVSSHSGALYSSVAYSLMDTNLYIC